MVERGGLEYPIRVRDEFSDVTAKFRDEIALSKKALSEFKKLAKGSKSTASDIKAQTKATNELAKAKTKLAKATKASLKPLTEEEKAARRLIRVRKAHGQAIERERRALEQGLIRARKAHGRALEAERKALERSTRARERDIKAARKAADSINPEVQARKRNARAALEEATAIKRVEQLKTLGRKQFREGDFRGGAKTLANAKKIEKSLKGQLGTAQKLLFTFRRLVGALAIFTLARRGVQVFNDLVKQGIKFNDVVANAQLGIAGLVVTLGDVRNAQGLSVDATEQLSVALGIAREQTAKLRQDSLKTVATFEQLLDTFQVSVGPGLAAGLNLDEVRQLTVDISQAAAALGVPQNQLAEEVRSLLSGTIQARTTRIATALGISNEDVRRLKEAGELFDFLEEKFAGFAEAAERQARTTFSGITTLIKGLVQEILGESARPLFEELIELGNDLFDNFLAVRDAAGNIRPSPEVVAAFQQIFDAIKRTVEAFRELGTGSAIDTLDAVLAGIAFTIDFIAGALAQLVGLFALAAGGAKDLAEFLGITSENAGKTAQFFGKLLVSVILVKKTIGLINVKVLKIVGLTGAWLAAFIVIGKAVEFVLEKIFGIELGIKDTIELISLGLLGAWFEFIGAIQKGAFAISNSFGAAIEAIISKTKSGALRARAAINKFFFDDTEAQALKDRAFDIEAQAKLDAKNRAARALLELKDIQDQTEAKVKAIQDQIAATVGARAGENAKGVAFREGFDPKKAAQDAADAANAFVSTAQRPISDLGASLAKINDELFKTEQLFQQAQDSRGLGGLAGQTQAIFDKTDIANAERLQKIRATLADTERAIIRLREASGVTSEREEQIQAALLTKVEDRDAAVKALAITEGEGGLVSALRDQLLLQNAILTAEEDGLQLANLKAATLAANALPALREENALLQASVAAERSRTAAVTSRQGDRQMALIAARTELELSREQLRITRQKNQEEIAFLILEAARLDPGKQQTALIKTIDALRQRKAFEEEILELRLLQLEAAEAEADLIANGSLREGLRRGFEELAESFSSQFQAGIDIATTAINGFVSFASQAIVDAFDPTKEEGTIKENFARLLQAVSRVILQKLIELAIAKLLIQAGFGGGDEGNAGIINATKIGAIRVSTELQIAAIRLANAQAVAAIKIASGGGGGLAQGGLVPEHFSKHAQGLALGGKPSHIPASDTIPAWLTPGEFVMRKSVVKSIGLPALEAMNGGNMPVVGSSSAEAAGPTGGMAHGGLVSDRLANSAAQGGGSEGGVVVVPAVVATDREMDTLTAGGKNALLAFMADNAGTINSALDRSNRQG